MLRGGSWGNYAKFLRAASRDDGHPGTHGNSFGFRVCRVAPIEGPTTGALDTGPLAR